MQPYFFPYIGYFQLMEAVDLFVFLDDVQYMKGGWVNRNRIRNRDKAHWLTLPVLHAPLTHRINQRSYMLGKPVAATKRKLQSAYRQSRGYEEVYPLIDSLLDFGNPTVSEFNMNSLVGVSRMLGVDCEFKLASSVAEADGLRGVDKVLRLCKHFAADQYVNPIGGVALYSPEAFSKNRIELSFIRNTCEPEMVGGSGEYLSIIHDLMAYGPAQTSGRLQSYAIVKPGEI